VLGLKFLKNLKKVLKKFGANKKVRNFASPNDKGNILR
jgi:hypothetical protein